MRWLRYGIFTLTVLLVLVLITVGWFVHGVSSKLDVVESPATTSSILDWAEPDALTQAMKSSRRNPALDMENLVSPPLSARPWTRWWWPGGDVNASAACKQLSQLHERGFGGVEIQAFNAGLSAIEDEDTQTRINSFDSKDWYGTLAEVIACAEKLGMAVYLNHLSGWPAGGPQVGLTDGLWTIRHGEAVVTGGREIRLDLPVPQPAVNDYLMALAEYFIDLELSGFAVEQRELTAVVAARLVGGERRMNPLDATDTLELDPESVKVLTEQVVDGELRWQAPEGDWVIIAAYLMPSAEAPTLIAARDPGYVIDHLDSEKLRAHYDYAYGTRTGLNAYYGGALQGFFNDSLEFKLDRLASTDILDAFAERRGYDLTPYLPAVFVDAYDNFFIRDVGRNHSAPSFRMSEHDERIRHDYQLTLSDLVIERFAETSSDWAQERNLLSRGQTYGFEMDTIRALGANHIPETEHLWGGSSEYVMKLAGAAGLLYERPLVSAESFVWLKRAYAVTPRHIKAGADLLFLTGVNQVIYHGIPYSSAEPAYRDTFGWLGWYPFQGPENPSGFAGNYGPATPTWNALPELNNYISRSQHILQSGRPVVDVLVYYPFLGFPKSIEDSEVAASELLFKGLLPGDPDPGSESLGNIPFVEFLPDEKDPRLAWLEKLIPSLRELDNKGITWTWVNGHALETGRVDPEQFEALLVADVEAMPIAVANTLASFQESPMDVFFLGELPSRQPGFANHEIGDAQVSTTLRALARGRQVANAAELAANIKPALKIEGGRDLRRVSRRGPGNTWAHLLVNRSVERASGKVTPTTANPPQFSYWFDAATGALWPATSGTEEDYSLSLGPLESRFLLFTDRVLDSTRVPLSVELDSARDKAGLLHGSPIELEGTWNVTAGGKPISANRPALLTTALPYLDGQSVEILYETEFEVTEDAARSRAVVALDSVAGIAELTINDVKLPTKSFDPFLFEVSGMLQPGTNELRIKVIPPLRNSLVSSEGLMDAELQQFSDKLGGAGLQGPVKIYYLPATEVSRPTQE